MADAQERMDELERRRAMLESSLARLRVLTSALSEATGGARRRQGRYLSK